MNVITVIVGRWRIAGIVNVTDDLVQGKPRFLERSQDLRFGPVSLLRRGKQGKRRAADEKKNAKGGQQFNERTAPLPRLGANPAHYPFALMVSSVIGWK